MFYYKIFYYYEDMYVQRYALQDFIENLSTTLNFVRKEVT